MLNKLGTTEKMVIYHPNGKLSYDFTTNPNGIFIEKTFDKNGKTLIIKDSEGYTAFFTRDEQGNKLAYKNSRGYYEVKNKEVTKEIYEAFIESLENPIKEYTMLNKLGTTEDMTEYHSNGKKSYEFKTDLNGLIRELTCDKNGYTLIAKNSYGYSCKYTRDEQGNELAFKNSDPYYEVKGKKVRKEQYEAFILSLEKKTTMLNKEIIDIAEMLQCEANNYAKELVSDKVSYQDAINTWIYLKLAELSHKLNYQNK